MADLTKEQIKEYQQKMAQEFLKEYNDLCERTGFVLIPYAIIDNEGRIRAENQIGVKPN
jgi:hypothetical protein